MDISRRMPKNGAHMKIYGKKNVWDAALDRIEFLFDEFPNIVCGVSGGKDSTVVFNLCLMVARAKKRLPLNVLFLDQEAEWQAVIDMVRTIMTNHDVRPMWMQIPIRLFNATSTIEHWLQCWDPAEQHRWMRPRESYSFHENRYGTDRFGKVFGAIMAHEFPRKKSCYISGVRTEESPTRFIALTHQKTYKWITWGKVLDKKLQHYTFYPIYDWSYSDVWKAIHDNHWQYTKLYDYMWQYGLQVKDMRVSNVHHETAVHSLFHLQEIEPETYERLCNRISGIDMAGKMGKDDFFQYDLPFMFKDWAEYRDYLLEKMIDNPQWRAGFRNIFDKHDILYAERLGAKMYKTHINSILTNDWEHIKLDNWEHSPEIYQIIKERRLELGITPNK